MVVYCCAYRCTNERTPGTKLRFHKFPLSRPEVLRLWIKAVRWENFKPSAHTVLCSDHFRESDYLESSLHKKLLKKDAVPSIFKFPKHLQVAPAVQRRKIIKKSLVEPKIPEAEPACKFQCVTKDIAVQTRKSAPEVRIKRKIKNLQQNVRRKTRKIRTMQDLIKHLNENSKCDTGLEEVLMNNFEGLSLDIFRSELHNSKVSPNRRRYSLEVRSFALTLYFYSPRAYSFLRKTMCLPHPAMLRKWLSVFNCEEGYLQEVFKFLKAEATNCDYLHDVALVFDSMAIRSQIVYDKQNDKHCGYVSLGKVASADAQELATETLVFMIVSYTYNFKCPIAYFYVNKINSILLKQFTLVAIQKLLEINIHVRSITCDGCVANIKAFSLLGCNLSSENMEAKFTINNFFSVEKLSIDKSLDVYCMLDPCHLIKLLRNAFAEMNISSPSGNIEFKFVERLHLLQEKEDLKLANSLTGAHIKFKQKKMNVRLAAQVISSSVADAIDFLRMSGVEEFKGSEATTEFLRIFDRIFDIMNSRSSFGKGYKSPMSLKNLKYWKNIFVETSEYIKKLKINECNVLQHARKTFALGFLMNIYSFEKLALLLLTREERPQKYFLTYKCSQDHLELYFCCIRAAGGWNNNPNAQQFKWTLQKLLFRNSVRPSVNGNCCANFNSDLAPVFDFRSFKNITDTQNSAVDEDLNYLISAIEYTSLSAFQNNVLFYICGVIIRKILNINPCTYCQAMITKNYNSDHNYYLLDINDSSSFTRFISNGKLYYPSRAIFEIVCYAERAFRAELNLGILGKNNFKRNIIRSVFQHFLPKLKSLFEVEHPVIENAGELHETQIIKFVTDTYSNIRIQTHAKKKSLQLLGEKATLRHKLNKTILFYHI